MSCTKKALTVVMMTTLLGLWGCTQSSSSPSGSARLRELEARTARLEDDCKAALAARDQARKKLSSLEEQRVQLLQQVEQLVRITAERDELKQTVAQRTAERDGVQTQLAQFSRDLQNLAVKIELAARPAPAASQPIATSPR